MLCHLLPDDDDLVHLVLQMNGNSPYRHKAVHLYEVFDGASGHDVFWSDDYKHHTKGMYDKMVNKTK